MQESQNNENLDGSIRLYHQSLEELECYLLSPANENQYTVEPSIASCGLPLYSSPSTHSFPSNESRVGQADCFSDISNHSLHSNCLLGVSRSGSSYKVDDRENKFGEYMEPRSGQNAQFMVERSNTAVEEPSQLSTRPEWLKQAMGIFQSKNLKEMLVVCAQVVADNNLSNLEWFLAEVRLSVSVYGDPLQRLGAYMLEGLVARLSSSGSTIYKALKCREPKSNELMSYMHLLYQICPYIKFAYLSANGAIAEAMKNESKIHIIDFMISQGTQWITLIQALADRPGGPPQLRITGIDDSFSAYARGGGIEIVGQRLSKLAESCGLPFEFNPVAISCCDVDSKHVKIQPDEALAVNFALVLHHMPDESVGTQNHRDRLLRMVKNLSPKVVTLVEQESNTNTAPFLPRFTETLSYYLAVFESIDAALPREHRERISVEQHCLARDIVNVIACEGPERVERHEPLGKWRLRFTMAGFMPVPLSLYVNDTIKTLLRNYSEKYSLQERDGCLFLGWMNRDLVASCAWV